MPTIPILILLFYKYTVIISMLAHIVTHSFLFKSEYFGSDKQNSKAYQLDHNGETHECNAFVHINMECQSHVHHSQ